MRFPGWESLPFVERAHSVLELAPGEYILTVHAKDFRERESSVSGFVVHAD